MARETKLQEGYEGGTDDTRASKDCTIYERDFIASYHDKAEVKRVDFLGTANHIAMADIIFFIAPQRHLQEGYDDGTNDTRANKDCIIDEQDFIASKVLIFLERQTVDFENRLRVMLIFLSTPRAQLITNLTSGLEQYFSTPVIHAPPLQAFYNGSYNASKAAMPAFRHRDFQH